MLYVDKLKIPTELDKRIKLRKEDYPKVFSLRDQGLTMKEIAKEFGVSRSLIRFVLDPDALAHAKECYKIRRKDGRYYDKKKHGKAIKNLRERKKQLV